jgi:phage terminase large subunit
MKSFITNKNKFGAQIKFKENSKYFIIKGSNKSIEYSNKIIKKIIKKDFISKVNLIK